MFYKLMYNLGEIEIYLKNIIKTSYIGSFNSKI